MNNPALDTVEIDTRDILAAALVAVAPANDVQQPEGPSESVLHHEAVQLHEQLCELEKQMPHAARVLKQEVANIGRLVWLLQPEDRAPRYSVTSPDAEQLWLELEGESPSRAVFAQLLNTFGSFQARLVRLLARFRATDAVQSAVDQRLADTLFSMPRQTDPTGAGASPADSAYLDGNLKAAGPSSGRSDASSALSQTSSPGVSLDSMRSVADVPVDEELFRQAVGEASPQVQMAVRERIDCAHRRTLGEEVAKESMSAVAALGSIEEVRSMNRLLLAYRDLVRRKHFAMP